MATYETIKAWLKANDRFTAQPCWIAHIKSEHGLTTRQAFNRIDPDRRVKPCPTKRRAAVERALRHFAMI